VKGQAAAVVSAQWMLDGERLANLNIDRGVGVQPAQTRTIVKLDNHYFE
jgi:restriction endonuclease Mrr